MLGGVVCTKHLCKSCVYALTSNNIRRFTLYYQIPYVTLVIVTSQRTFSRLTVNLSFAEIAIFQNLSVMDSISLQNQSVALVERPTSETLGVQLVDSERSGRKTQSDLVELAKEIQKADEFTRSTACSKLQMIAEQVKFLHEQARKILEEAKLADNLHHVACNFKKVPGNVYYLYRRPSGQKYFSMLSPQEWGRNCPHEFLGGYRLEADMSWTQATQLDRKDRELAAINQILDGNKPLIAAIEFVEHPK